MAVVAIRVATMSPSAALAALGCALFLLSSSAAARRALGRGDARAVASVAATAALVAALLAAVRARRPPAGPPRSSGVSSVRGRRRAASSWPGLDCPPPPPLRSLLGAQRGLSMAAGGGACSGARRGLCPPWRPTHGRREELAAGEACRRRPWRAAMSNREKGHDRTSNKQIVRIN